MTAEKETEKPAPIPTASKPQAASKSTPASAEPKSGDRTVIDGEPHVWIPGFGWILDEGVGSVCTTVGNPGDQLPGHKVGIMGGGTTVDGKGDIHKQVGIMGGADSAPHETSAPPSKQPEITGDVIYIELHPPVTKDSAPPVFRPNGEPHIP